MQTATRLAVLCLLPAIGVAQEPPSRDELIDRFADVLADRAVTDAEAFETNGFRVESSRITELGADLQPTGRDMESLSVTADQLFRVGVEKGRETPTSGGVGIYHRETGQPMLTASDRDGDGRIDFLEILVLDDDGEAIVSVVDYEADGQPDMRIHFEESYFEIWHLDRWHRTETRDGRRGIVIDGEFVELQQADNRWIVP